MVWLIKFVVLSDTRDQRRFVNIWITSMDMRLLILVALLLKMRRTKLLTKRKTKASVSHTVCVMGHLSCCKNILGPKFFVWWWLVWWITFFILSHTLTTISSLICNLTYLSLIHSVRSILYRRWINISTTYRSTRTRPSSLSANSIILPESFRMMLLQPSCFICK